ncbi:MAG: hypothetical protein LBI47_01105 [Puniceicoccales bacterium]|nr:hypothetical protein [Puniceicoccales bacterium]
MKKILLAASVMCGVVGLCANGSTNLPEQNLTIDFGVGLKNEYFSHGRHELRKVYIPRAKVGYQIFDEVWMYTGIDSALGMAKDSLFNHVSPLVGISYNVTDEVKLDTRYLHHFYTKMPKKDRNGQPTDAKRYSNEISLGVVFDTFMKLSLGGSYDFEHKEATLEGAAGYNFDLSFLISGLGVDMWAKVGNDCTKKPWGMARLPKTHYYYYGAGADLAYKINCARVKVGVGYEGNSANKKDWMNAGSGGKKNSFVLSASIDCSF